MWGIGILLLVGSVMQLLVYGTGLLNIVFVVVSVLFLAVNAPFTSSFVGNILKSKKLVMAVSIVLLAVFVLSGALINPFGEEKNAASAYNRGIKYIGQQKFEKAQKVLEEAEKTSPGDYQVNLAQGILYLNMQNYNKAINSLNSAVKKNPYDANILFNIALAQYHSKDFNRALSTFEGILDLNPRILRARIYAGILCRELGNYPKAIYHLREARWLAPDSFEVQYYLGQCFFDVMAYEEAKNAFEQVLKLSPPKGIEEEANKYIDEIENYGGVN